MFLEPHRDLASLYQNLQLITHPISNRHVSSAQKQWANRGRLAHSSGRLLTGHLTLGQGRSFKAQENKSSSWDRGTPKEETWLPAKNAASPGVDCWTASLGVCPVNLGTLRRLST